MIRLFEMSFFRFCAQVATKSSERCAPYASPVPPSDPDRFLYDKEIITVKSLCFRSNLRITLESSEL